MQGLFHSQLLATMVSFTVGFLSSIRNTLRVCTYFSFFAVVFSPGVVGKHTLKYGLMVIFVIYDEICVCHFRSDHLVLPCLVETSYREAWSDRDCMQLKFICLHIACCPSHRYPTDIMGLWSLVREHSWLYHPLFQALKHSIETASMPLLWQLFRQWQRHSHNPCTILHFCISTSIIPVFKIM